MKSSICTYVRSFNRSRPARALWIEIDENKLKYALSMVEAREGLVD